MHAIKKEIQSFPNPTMQAAEQGAKKNVYDVRPIPRLKEWHEREILVLAVWWMKLRINEETRREYESNALSNLGCNSNAKTPPRISAQSHAAKISFRKSLANILGGRPILGKMPFVFSPLSLSPPSSFLIPSLCCFFQNDRALSSLPHLENLLFFLLISKRASPP